MLPNTDVPRCMTALSSARLTGAHSGTGRPLPVPDALLALVGPPVEPKDLVACSQMQSDAVR